MSVLLSDICELLEGELIGDGSVMIDGIAEVEKAGIGEITFVVNKRYADYLNDSKASAVIIAKDMDTPTIPAIRVKDTQIAKAKTLSFFHPRKQHPPEIDKSAIIGEKSVIGEKSYIGAGSVIKDGAVLGIKCSIMENVFIDGEVIIGDECVINPGAVIISKTTIGNRVEIGSCSVIGGEGFGYLPDKEGILKVPQVGSVLIEDDVSIGSNCCIDRGTMGETIIRKGAKLDNLIQIAHNVEVGENTIIAAQTGVSGSTKIGSGVLMGGQAGLAGHITVGNGVKIGGRAGVTKSFPDGVVISGFPARVHKESLLKDASISNIPKMADKIKILEKEVKELKKR